VLTGGVYCIGSIKEFSFYHALLSRAQYCDSKSSVCDVKVSWSHRLG